MSRKVDCPVVRWPGSVTLPDYLTLPQYNTFRRALRAAVAYRAGEMKAALEKDPEAQTFEFDSGEYNERLEPGLMACIEKFELQGLTVNGHLPATPAKDSQALFEWLESELLKLARGEEDIPKA